MKQFWPSAFPDFVYDTYFSGPLQSNSFIYITVIYHTHTYIHTYITYIHTHTYTYITYTHTLDYIHTLHTYTHTYIT
jgi:hypothetical protein